MATVGIIGAGQLGQMLGFAGKRLGLDFVFLDPADQPPAAQAGEVLKFPFDSPEGLRRLSSVADVISYEFENVPAAAIDLLGGGKPAYPSAEALACAQDRLSEKNRFESLDIPVPAYRPIDSAEELQQAAEDLSLPLVLKTRRFGYDGKGQVVVRDREAITAAVKELGGKNLLAEQLVPFDREVSIIGARNTSGETAIYPLTENLHRNGILLTSRAPADDEALAATASDYLLRLLDSLDYVGVLALELFVSGDRLLANEFAPRVHNSGHWTIDAAVTSQFENHLRAILGMPLGDPASTGHAGMVNLIGEMPPADSPLCAAPWILHDYGKSARPGRKLGHATVVDAQREKRDRMLSEGARLLPD